MIVAASKRRKPACEDGEVQALQAFNEMQERFQIVFDECRNLWQKTDQGSGSVDAGTRKSWRSAWGKLQVELKAAFHDIASGQSQCLTVRMCDCFTKR